MFFGKFNNTSPFASLDINLDAIEGSFTLEELAKSGATAQVVAIMFSEKGEYGRSAFVVGSLDDVLFTMWLPQHQVKICEEIMADPEAIERILSGHCGIRGRSYVDKKRIVRYSAEWCDL